MRAFLVNDDEPLALRRLSRLLEATGLVEVVGTESDPALATERLTPGAADVLVLDIEMPGLNGFQLLARLEEPPLVVFTTAFDQYALRAFQANSIDYLLKSNRWTRSNSTAHWRNSSTCSAEANREAIFADCCRKSPRRSSRAGRTT